jgi:hypothetical protein
MHAVDAAVNHYIEHQKGWSSGRFVKCHSPIHDDSVSTLRYWMARAEPLLGVLDGLAELLQQLVVVVGGQQVTRRDDHRDRPVDELECR